MSRLFAAFSMAAVLSTAVAAQGSGAAVLIANTSTNTSSQQVTMEIYSGGSVIASGTASVAPGQTCQVTTSLLTAALQGSVPAGTTATSTNCTIHICSNQQTETRVCAGAGPCPASTATPPQQTVWGQTYDNAPGAVVAYGSGCGASGRVLVHGNDHPCPSIGQSGNLTLSGGPAGSPAVFAIGIGQANINLGFIGMPNCTLWVNPAPVFVTFGSALNGSGMAALPFPIPNDPGLIGGTFNTTGAAVWPGANPNGVATANGLDWTIGG